VSILLELIRDLLDLENRCKQYADSAAAAARKADAAAYNAELAEQKLRDALEELGEK